MSIYQIPESFGNWVKSLRKRLDLTQADLGWRTGCSAATIRKIEANERKPSLQLVEILARALEVPELDKQAFLQLGRGILIDHPIHPQSEILPGVANNLPTLLTSTIDRTHDLTAVIDLFRQNSTHLITLLGPPGIGKTRLSIHCGTKVLYDFPDGVWFVDLAEIDNADFFIPTIARSIETIQLSPSPKISQLINALKDKKLFLILDNFEHIVDFAANDITRILKACSDVKILVTSRIPLHVYGEQEYPLPALSIPPRQTALDADNLMNYESVQLLVARIRQHQPKFTVTQKNSDSIISICAMLEGIPLSLELAAASLRHMTLEQMSSLLTGVEEGSWVKQFSTPARDLPHRQRTLENVVAWSYHLLSIPQSELFCKLGVFPGWFDLEAVAHICVDQPSSGSDVLELVSALSDQSLLVQDDLHGCQCWHMLEIIRNYANLQLVPAVRIELEQRFIQHYIKQLEKISSEPEIFNKDIFYELNSTNFHTALKYAIARGDSELGFILAEHLGTFWDNYGYMKEGLELVKKLIALPYNSPPEVRANHLQAAADLAWQQSDFDASLLFSKEAVEFGLTHGLQDKYPEYLNRLGRIYIEQGCLSEARQVLEECLVLARANPDLMKPGVPLAQLGEVTLFEGRYDDARQAFLEAIPNLTSENGIFLAIAMVDMAEIALERRDFLQAHSWLQQAFRHVRTPIRRTMVYLCTLSGYLILLPDSEKGKLLTAIRLLGALDALSDRSGIILGAFYQDVISERVKIACMRISEQEYSLARQEGRSLGKEQALMLAMKLLT